MRSAWPQVDDPQAKLFNDQVHGYIKLNGLCVKLMDTPQFQRLRDLKQLGTLYYVFPGASHNRFEHSLGVGFLAGETVERFRLQQPELELTARDSRLLHEFMPRVASKGYGGSETPSYHHEDMSNRMIEYMVDDNAIDLEREDVRFIQQLIVGAKETHLGSNSRVDSRGYLYEIVANGRNCIDVDKFDYLARDMLNLFGLRKVFDFSRLAMFNRVIGDQICYHTSVNLDIYDMFQQRYQMHKQIYNHRKGKAVEFMICDAMLLADQELGISAATQTPQDFQFLTDHVVHSIEASKSDTLEPARALLKRMRRRELYEFIDEYLLPPELVAHIPRFSSDELACQVFSNGVHLNPEDIIISDGRLNYNFQDRNPVDSVSFYASNDLNLSFHIPKEEVSLLFPEKVSRLPPELTGIRLEIADVVACVYRMQFEERVIRVYSRQKSPQVHAAIQVRRLSSAYLHQ
ncbi:hypothetical protein BBJ28_00013278 [Nothophytophthora sp. Chile5]|nr:hypothetical protein BBJ28_00013278 [Nothophytophthora sp. Chile5]